MVITGIDSETSGASVCRIQSSALGLLPELGPRNYSYCSRHLQRCCRFSALNSGCKGAAGLVITGIDSETSGASACCIQMSELGLILELDSRNYLHCSSDLERLSIFARNSGCRRATELVRTENNSEA